MNGATGAAAWAALGACVVALAPAGARWLRVAQREHYLAGAGMRFAARWWRSEPLDLALAVAAVAGLVAAVWWPLAALATAVAVAAGPRRLSVRGRTSKLAFTRRLKTLAAVWVVLQAAIVAVGAAVGEPAPLAAAGALLVPVLVDTGCLATAPLERHLIGRYVGTARDRLRRVSPAIVGITGSYGKTSTKNYVAHLVAGTRTIVASPASFNNRAGLARAVNEHLVEGTEVFVAEMGTYGPGEIRELCQWCPPTIAVLTAIGPVHLERFGSEDAIAIAKSEIAEPARVVVVNADDPRLERLATGWTAAGGRRVVRCSATDETADVCVQRKDGTATLTVGGDRVAVDLPLREGVQPTNLACAVAVALQLGVRPEEVVARIATVPSVPNRLSAAQAASGVYVVDDTFNSNPAGARAALAVLRAAPVDGRRVLVTPGMVELGPRQAAENEAFAADAGAVATDLVVVGRTNRRALLRGWAGEHGPVVVDTRDQAVTWVRAHLGPGDAVLYENDLPDHYP